MSYLALSEDSNERIKHAEVTEYHCIRYRGLAITTSSTNIFCVAMWLLGAGEVRPRLR